MSKKIRNMSYVESVQDTHPVDEVEKAYKAGYAWWQHKVPSLIITLIMSMMDFIVLYIIFDKGIKQEDWQNWILSIGLCIVLNFIPLFLAKSIQNYQYGFNRDRAKKEILLCLVAFTCLYITLLIVRFAYYDIFINTSTSAQSIRNAVAGTGASGSVAEEVSGADSWRAIAFTLLTGVSPLVTSVINGVLAYFTNNEKKEKLKEKEMRRQELLMEIIRIDSALENLKRDPNEYVVEDEGRYEAAKQIVHYKCAALRSKALFLLAEHAARVDAISLISQDAVDGAEKALLPEVQNHIPVSQMAPSDIASENINQSTVIAA